MRRCTISIALALAPACGPSTPAATTDGTSTAEATTTTATSTGMPPTTGSTSSTSDALPEPSSSGTTTAPDTTTTGSTTAVATTDNVGTTSGDTTGDPGSTTLASSSGSDSEAPAEPTTMAWWVSGTQTTVRVIQRDPGAGLCRGVIVESLDGGGGGNAAYAPVDTPPQWLVHYIFLHENLDDCFDPYDWWVDNAWVSPVSATGSVVFHEPDDLGRPASVDIDITGTYEPGDAWVPAQDTLLVVAVPVMNG